MIVGFSDVDRGDRHLRTRAALGGLQQSLVDKTDEVRRVVLGEDRVQEVARDRVQPRQGAGRDRLGPVFEQL